MGRLGLHWICVFALVALPIGGCSDNGGDGGSGGTAGGSGGTADDKVGLITGQVQQIEKLVAIMIEVLAVRLDNGTAPYDLWNKALEPAEDAQVLLQGVVKLLKTRNRNRY